MVAGVWSFAGCAAVLAGTALLLGCGDARPADVVTNAAAGAGAAAGNAGVPGTGGTPTAGAGGAGAAAPTAGAPPASVEPATTGAYTWEECGRIPSSPADHDAHYAADGTLALLQGGGRLVLRSPVDRRIVADLPSPASTFAISNDATLLAEPVDGGVALRSLPDGDLLDTLSGPAEGCPDDAARFSPAGDMVMTYGETGLCAWRIADGTLLVRLPDASFSAAFDADVIVVAYYPSTNPGTATVARFDLTGLELARFPLAAEAEQRQPIVSPDGKTVATTRVIVDAAVSARVSALWSSDDGHLLWSHSILDCEGEPVFSPAGDFVMMGCTSRVSDGAVVWELLGYAYDWRSTLALSPTGDEVTGVSGLHLASRKRDDGLPRSWSGHLRDELGSPVQGMRSLAITPDGSRLVSLATEGLSWDLARHFEDSLPRTGFVTTLASRVEVSPDGRWASFAGDGRLVHSLEGEGRVSFSAPAGLAPCIWLQFRFSPDGQWLVGSSYLDAFNSYRVADFPAALQGGTVDPVWSSGEAGCPTVGSLASSYQSPVDADGDASGWPRLRSVASDAESDPFGSFGRDPFDDLVYSPDSRDSISTADCSPLSSDSGGPRCEARFSSTRWEESNLPETLPPFPAFDPEGHWVVAGSSLIHLPSGEVRVFDPDAAVATFAPNGDIIAGERDASLVRYCRTPPAP